MKHLHVRHLFFLLSGTWIAAAAAAQSKNEFVPCQEMPHLIQNYNADYRALVRFYSPAAANASRGGMGGGGDAGVGSPERRERLKKINQEYLKKLEALDFRNLPQECKVDYILFKRDIDQRLRQSEEEAAEFEKAKPW